MGVFPAYAGMFPAPPSEPADPTRFPRVCGDVPAHCSSAMILLPFSPHVRGHSESKPCNEEDASEQFSQRGSLFNFPTHN